MECGQKAVPGAGVKQRSGQRVPVAANLADSRGIAGGVGIRLPAQLLLWLGGLVCGLAVQKPAAWALTVAFLATLCALLALRHCDALALDGGSPERLGQ